MIRAPTPATWAYAESFVVQDAVLERARARAEELGCSAVPAGTGAALRLLAATLSARSVVEIGTGAGVGALYLLQGMPEDGVLTSIDVEVENQRAAREAFADAGLRPGRARLIPGRGLDVLPRLTDSAYDLVVIDADQADYPAYLEPTLRLLRPGGLLAIDHALLHDQVADPARRDPATVGVRELGRAVREHEGLLPAMLPCGDGLLLAVKR